MIPGAGEKYLQPDKVADGGKAMIISTQQHLVNTPTWILIIILLVMGILFLVFAYVLFYSKSQKGNKATVIVLEPRKRENKKKFVVRRVQQEQTDIEKSIEDEIKRQLEEKLRQEREREERERQRQSEAEKQKRIIKKRIVHLMRNGEKVGEREEILDDFGNVIKVQP